MMKANQLLIVPCGLLAGFLALIAPQPAFAGGLHIHTVLMPGNPPPPAFMQGGGNLQAIFEVAAKKWEHVFRDCPDSWDITIEYQWSGEPSGYADATFEGEGGTPVRPTRGRVRFRNTATPNGLFDWYADPHPETNAAYQHYESLAAEVLDEEFNVTGEEINVGRVFTAETGPAVGHTDLLSVAMHEIGHCLGLHFDYSGNIEQVTGNGIVIRSPLPFASAFVFLVGSTHIETYGATVVMTASPAPGSRTLITEVDALVIAQLTSFEQPDLGDPPGVPKVKDLICCRLVLGPAGAQTPPVPDLVQ